jgi:signal transduction histidine kinase
MLRLTVRRRIFLLLLVVSLIPLALANVIWLLSSQAELRDEAASRQQLLVASSADAVSDFINDKVNDAIIHSQTTDVQNMQLAGAQAELTAYLKQDADVTQIALVDASGQQRLLVNRQGVSTKVENVSSTNAFRVVTFLSGEDYISPVSFDAQHQGQVTISVPLISFTTTQDGSYLSTSEPGVILAPSAIKGALIVNVALQQLWNSVLANKLGQSGYAYVVDAQGDLIAYPQANYAIRHSSLAAVDEVKTALAESEVPGAAIPQPSPRETVSETGVKVLSSHYRIARTGWIVVAEEPISSVYAPVNNDVRVAAGFFLLTALIGLGLIMLMARSVLRPIKALSEGANRVAGGDLDYRISMPGRDEFGLLAQTFNNLAAKVSADITKLQDVDSLKNEFIYIASHNLRTPLTVIRGYIDSMKDVQVTAETRAMLGAIEDSANELLGFSEDMLAISTIEAGYATIEITDMTSGELLAPIRKEYDALAEKKGVQMVWSVPDPSIIMRLSPVHIRSALSNLLGNALEFTPKGGRVEFALDKQAQSYVMSVVDNGTGIEPAEMGKLFTKFHRGTSTLRYDHAGTGIGLYLTRLIVEAHHGRITVRSQRGHGSKFTIVLPAGE